MVINVIDYRRQYPQAMVKQALESLGFHKEADKLRHVSYGVVSLSPSAASDLGIDTSDGKASYAMSGRQGIGIKITELIHQVAKVIEDTRSDKNGLSSHTIATASIRYYLLRFALQTEVVFDLKQATEISGNTGYTCSTPTRVHSACSIKRKKRVFRRRCLPGSQPWKKRSMRSFAISAPGMIPCTPPAGIYLQAPSATLLMSCAPCSTIFIRHAQF